MSRLYLRVFLGFCAANLLTLVVTMFVTERIARNAYTNIEPDWGNLARDAARVYDGGGPGDLRTWARGMQVRGFQVAFYSGSQLLVDREPVELLAEHLPELLAAPAVELHPAPETTVVGILVERADREPFRFLAARKPHLLNARLWLLAAIQLVISVIVVAIFGWQLTRSISAPVAAVQDAARRLAEGELSARVSGATARRPDELGQLARDFDGMAGRIQASVEHTRALLQDISHELRSPLARLHLAIELASGAAPPAPRHLEHAQREITQLDAIIAETLALSRMEAQLPGGALEPVELVPLLQDCAERKRDVAAARQITLRVDAEPQLATVDPALLARAVRNLLQNAIKYGAPGSEVTLRLRREGAEAIVAVLDRGPGVPADQLEAIFRPFYRGANATLADGTGLGLSIVERVARAHHGTVRAANREGGGLTVELRLPLGGVGGASG